MKNILSLIAALALCAGCKTNSIVAPALVRLGVSTRAGYALVKYPAARPGVAEGQQIVCAVAQGQDLSPGALVAALDAAGVDWTPESWFIVNGCVGAFNLAYNGLKDPDSSKAKPYLDAVCAGMTDALGAPEPVTRAASLARTTKWPQLK